MTTKETMNWSNIGPDVIQLLYSQVVFIISMVFNYLKNTDSGFKQAYQLQITWMPVDS